MQNTDAAAADLFQYQPPYAATDAAALRRQHFLVVRASSYSDITII